MSIDRPKKEILNAVKDTSKRISKVVADTAVTMAGNTREAVVATAEKVTVAIEEKKPLLNSNGRRSLNRHFSRWKELQQETLLLRLENHR